VEILRFQGGHYSTYYTLAMNLFPNNDTFIHKYQRLKLDHVILEMQFMEGDTVQLTARVKGYIKF
jgi:hypothetical protein